MGQLKSSILELRGNLASAKARSDQADMEHRDLNVRLKGLMWQAMENDDDDALANLIDMYMRGQTLKSENNHLIEVTEIYLALLEELDGFEKQ